MTYATRESVSAFVSSYPFPAGTGEERKPDIAFQRIIAHGYAAPLWTIPTRAKEYKVSKPIKVKIYCEDNLFIAENETLVVIGTGESITDAINDLGKHIIHFYKYYKKLSWDRVTGDAVRLKRLYDNLFVDQDS